MDRVLALQFLAREVERGVELGAEQHRECGDVQEQQHGDRSGERPVGDRPREDEANVGAQPPAAQVPDHQCEDGAGQRRSPSPPVWDRHVVERRQDDQRHHRGDRPVDQGHRVMDPRGGVLAQQTVDGGGAEHQGRQQEDGGGHLQDVDRGASRRLLTAPRSCRSPYAIVMVFTYVAMADEPDHNDVMKPIEMTSGRPLRRMSSIVGLTCSAGRLVRKCPAACKMLCSMLSTVEWPVSPGEVADGPEYRQQQRREREQLPETGLGGESEDPVVPGAHQRAAHAFPRCTAGDGAAPWAYHDAPV